MIYNDIFLFLFDFSVNEKSPAEIPAGPIKFAVKLLLCALLYCNLLQVPDVLNILFDSSVGGELTALCNVDKCGLRPALFIAVLFFYALLSFCVRNKVLKDEVLVSRLITVGL